jgi:TetR/AcrR family transcriptional regulator, transcriptional repressor for nem operon
MLKIVHPERSGLHLDNIDYDDTLAVVAAPSRSDDEEVRATIGASPGGSGGSGGQMGYSKRDKAETHTRIVSVAAKRFRERGLEGIGVADVMKEAGVTVGGFYKHFDSRDELVVEALATAFQNLDLWEEHTDTLTKLLENYLSEEHRDAPGTGCALGALLGDMSRASRSARAVYTARYKRTLAYSTGLVPPNGPSARRARAILMISAMLGAINLSRAVSDPNLSREILQQTRDQLISLHKPAKPS